jgi:hypothetical protein
MTDISLNFSPNSNPLLMLFVDYVERTGPIDLRIFRVRDGYLKWNDKYTADLVIEFAIGGDLRGGSNGALWARLRAHPLYLSDADSLIPDHAEVKFFLKASVNKAATKLLKYVPAVGVTPEQKLKDSIQAEAGNVKPTYPACVEAYIVNHLQLKLAASIEMLPDLRKKVDSLSTEPKKTIEELITLAKTNEVSDNGEIKPVVTGVDFAALGTKDETGIQIVRVHDGIVKPVSESFIWPRATDQDYEGI